MFSSCSVQLVKIGNSPLHFACNHENLELVSYLLGRGAIADVKNKVQIS
jgi:ankyrin repeat protein